MKEDATMKPPNTFNGLTYAPDTETCIDILLGMLIADSDKFKFFSKQIPLIRIKKGEAWPKKQGDKWFDLLAQTKQEGKWRDARIELKVRASGIRRDCKKYPTIGDKLDYLICWENDMEESEIKKYKLIDKIFPLKPIIHKFHTLRKRKYVYYPNFSWSFLEIINNVQKKKLFKIDWKLSGYYGESYYSNSGVKDIIYRKKYNDDQQIEVYAGGYYYNGWGNGKNLIIWCKKEYNIPASLLHCLKKLGTKQRATSGKKEEWNIYSFG